ncbi:MAG: hypothetical protein WKG07_08465 [Hymenobacter sp.]
MTTTCYGRLSSPSPIMRPLPTTTWPTPACSMPAGQLLGPGVAGLQRPQQRRPRHQAQPLRAVRPATSYPDPTLSDAGRKAGCLVFERRHLRLLLPRWRLRLAVPIASPQPTSK